MKFIGRVINGKANIYDKNKMAIHIATFEGKEIEIEIKKLVIRKTPSQMAGLFVLIGKFTEYLNEATGNELSVDEVKDLLKAKRNWTEDIVDKNTGDIIGQKLRSFADLSLEEASAWIEWIFSYSATEWNFKLPILEPK